MRRLLLLAAAHRGRVLRMGNGGAPRPERIELAIFVRTTAARARRDGGPRARLPPARGGRVHRVCERALVSRPLASAV